MTQLKRRLSLLLCMLLVFTSTYIAIPEEAQAGTYNFFSDIGAEADNIYVYKGASNFFVGDYFLGYSQKFNDNGGYTLSGHYLTYYDNATYTSSDKSVATVNKTTGEVKIKKAGTTTITVKWQGIKDSFKLNVLSKTNFFKEVNKRQFSDYKKIASDYDKAAKAFLKASGTSPKITSKNRYKILTAYANYASAYESAYLGCYEPDSSTGNYKSNYYIFSPTAGRANMICHELNRYAAPNNPFTTWSSKCFNVKSISGKGSSKTISLVLKDKVTATQIFGANYAYSWDTEIKESSTYTFPIVVQCKSNGYKYRAIATIKKGSSKMTIKLTTGKLVKGKTYKLLAISSTGNYPTYMGDWLDDGTNKNTFRAK